VCVRLWTLAGIQREMAQTTGFRVTDWLRIGLTMEVFSPTETHSPAGMRHGLYLGVEVVDEQRKCHGFWCTVQGEGEFLMAKKARRAGPELTKSIERSDSGEQERGRGLLGPLEEKVALFFPWGMRERLFGNLDGQGLATGVSSALQGPDCAQVVGQADTKPRWEGSPLQVARPEYCGQALSLCLRRCARASTICGIIGMPGGAPATRRGAQEEGQHETNNGTKHSALNGAGRVDRLRASGATGELGCLGPSSPTDCVSRRRLPATCPKAAPRTPQEAPTTTAGSAALQHLALGTTGAGLGVSIPPSSHLANLPIPFAQVLSTNHHLLQCPPTANPGPALVCSLSGTASLVCCLLLQLGSEPAVLFDHLPSGRTCHASGPGKRAYLVI
jgi:hypothetical protein